MIFDCPLGAPKRQGCPDTMFILDHCGVPDIAGGGYETWSKDMADLSKRPNIAVKISGITAYAKPDWTLDTLRPYFETAIDKFGWERVVWGSDSPVCTLQSSLDQWVAATHALLAGATTEERAKLLHLNAFRVWKVIAR